MAKNQSRYRAVSRRSFMRGSMIAGVVSLVPGLGCSSGDEAVFGSSTADGGAAPTTTTTSPNADSSEPTTARSTVTQGAPVSADAELIVAFSFTPDDGGRILNPYVAVWIEDASGALVATIALWYEQTSKGERWVKELRRWFMVEGDLVDAGGETPIDLVSSATRAAGSFSVIWDGTDEAGATVTQGDYFVCIEAAREHGPYQLIREPIVLGDEAFSLALPDNGELTAASVSFVV